MLIKFRFIGLLLVFLFSHTTIYGQNKSLDELHKDLNYYHNVVDAKDMWFFKRRRGPMNLPPAFLPKNEGMEIWFVDNYGKDGQITEAAMQQAMINMYNFSKGVKLEIRKNTIPAIESAIRNHPDNPNNSHNPNTHHNPTLSSAETCHSIGKPGPLTLGNKQMGWKCHYYSNGQLNYERQYKNGVLHGTSNKYLKSGHPESLSEYWNGKLVRTEQYSRIHLGKMTKCWVKEADGSKTSCMPK